MVGWAAVLSAPVPPKIGSTPWPRMLGVWDVTGMAVAPSAAPAVVNVWVRRTPVDNETRQTVPPGSAKFSGATGRLVIGPPVDSAEVSPPTTGPMSGTLVAPASAPEV